MKLKKCNHGPRDLFRLENENVYCFRCNDIVNVANFLHYNKKLNNEVVKK